MGVDINKDEVIMCDTSALLLLKKDDITSLKQNHEAECHEEKTDEIMAVQIADGSNMPTFEVPRAAVTQEITPTSIHNETEYGMPKQVAVTGAGGFIASWIVKLLRQEGYHVQAAVCNLDNEVQSEHLKNMKGDKEWLELVKADVLDYAAMLAAVDGMKVCSIGVFHKACPVTGNITDPEDWYCFAKTKAEKAA
ncbi:unnamed protein product [Sphagnum troendelagicum]